MAPGAVRFSCGRLARSGSQETAPICGILTLYLHGTVHEARHVNDLEAANDSPYLPSIAMRTCAPSPRPSVTAPHAPWARRKREKPKGPIFVTGPFDFLRWR